jgi:hypothetical protein
MGVVLIGGSAAYATQNTNITGGTGEETGITVGTHYGNANAPIHCLSVTDSTYSVALSGTFYGSNSISYVGGATLTWDTSPTYWINEGGTYTSADHSSGCDSGTLGDAIASSWTLIGGNTTDGINCTSGSNTTGNYSRVDDQITLTFTGTCTVYDSNSTNSVTTSSTVFTFTGTLNACNVDVDPNCQSSTITNGHLTSTV